MPITPDTYTYRLPLGQTLRVVTRKQPNGEVPQATLEQPTFTAYSCGEKGSPFTLLNQLAASLEATAKAIRAVAAELPQ